MKKLFYLLAIVAILVGLAVPVSAAGPNLIVNGDFEAGNTGFITEYNYLDPSNTGTWTLGPEYMYTVSTDPNLYHSAWTSFGDNTTGTGKMMIVNGTWLDYSPAEALVWGQTVTLPVCDTMMSYPLYAGKTWMIGKVLVKSEPGKVCVKFVLTDPAAIAKGWVITEAHVAIGSIAADIPQKNGNPIPGQFPINVKINPGVTETAWYCLPWTNGIPVIAAHVALVLPGVAPKSETGWGAGGCGTNYGSFPGKNWATYICYTPKVCYTLYTLEFWAGNSFPGSVEWPAQPAMLEVKINGEVVGELDLAYTPPTAPTPGWMKFSVIWNAGSATSANIQIRDKRYIMYGDDFVIDDISFVKQ